MNIGINKKTKYSADIEPQEALLDKLAQKKEDELGISWKKFEVPLSQKILKIFWIASLLIFSFLFFKTFQLQVIDGESYLLQAQNNKFLISQIQAERGVIYDKNMNQLVFNKPAFELILNKANLPKEDIEKDRILQKVSLILEIPFEDFKKEILESEGNILSVYNDISQEKLITLESRINEFSGFKIRKDWVREYENSKDFSHVIGYLGKITSEELNKNQNYSVLDWVGRSGLEKTYEEHLKKNSGKLQIERDALGNEISRQVIEQPNSGDSLVLWIDSDLQKKIIEELEKILELVGAEKAAVVALDPKTGGVLSLISVPSFDNNLFQKGSDQSALQSVLTDSKEPLFNRAVSGRYLTGSAI
ncbi:penicillin-binding transpeptidase domain-containing protein, partial [Patescibacteria group bacterium]